MNSVTVVAILSGLILFLAMPMFCTAQLGIWFSKNKKVFYRMRKASWWMTLLFAILIIGEILMPNI
jgi:hypothetical protein